jgi:hypothetical protein
LGSQVATLTSSNPAIVVDGSGNLTLGVDLSGSVTQSGDSFTSLISWEDQYGNQDSTTITATVFGNQAPAASFTDNGLTDVTAVSGSNIGSLSITDVESNSPFVVTIGGTDGGKFNIIPQNAASSSWIVQPTGSLSIGTYSVQFTVTDSYSEQAILNETISVTSDSDFGKVYIYYSSLGDDTSLQTNYNAVMGASTLSGDTPPEVTSLTPSTGSPYYVLSGSMGQSSYSLSGGATMTLASTVSGSNFETIVSQSAAAMSWTPGTQTIIVFPSGSDMVGFPTNMADNTGGSTNGEYVLVEYIDGTTPQGGTSVTNSTIHLLDIDGSHLGYDKWFVIGARQQSNASTMRLRVIPSSGSVSNF